MDGAAGFEEEEDASGDQSCPPFDGDGSKPEEPEKEPEKEKGMFDEEEEEGD